MSSAEVSDRRPARRVLLVSHYYPPHLGGIENVVQAQADGLAARGVDVTVLTSACTGPAGPASAGQPAGPGPRIIRVPAWNGLEARTGVPFPVFSPAIAAAMFRAVRATQVVHLHDVLYLCAWVAAACARVLRRPYVITQHVSLVDHPSRLVRAVQRAVYGTLGAATLRGAEQVWVLNGRVLEFVVGLGVPRDRVRLLPNGVDGERFRPAADAAEKESAREHFGLPATAPIALFVGRFVPKKGFDVVVAAADDRFCLAAAGGTAPAGRSLPPSVCVLGPLGGSDMAIAYRAADIFVLPSKGEGFPLTVQEAMASGLPVVLGDDDAYDCYQLDRRLVRFVPVEACAVHAALVELAGDRDLRAEMAGYSREVAVTAFSWERHLDTLQAAYRHAPARG